MSSESMTPSDPAYQNENIEVVGADEEIVIELRESLGAIPEVVALHGRAEDHPLGSPEALFDSEHPNPYDVHSPSSASPAASSGEPSAEPSAYNNEGEGASASSSSASSASSSPSASASSSSAATSSSSSPAAPTSYVTSAADLKLNYVTTMAEVNPSSGSSSSDSPALSSGPRGAATPESVYEKRRREVDHRLAKLAAFLPQKLIGKLNDDFNKAVALAKDQTDDAYTNATEALNKLNKKLDDSAPQLGAAECKHLREKVRKTLANDGALLTKPDLKWHQEAFSEVDIDPPSGEGAQEHLESLREVSANLDGAIEARINAITDLITDYERLTPILTRALKIEHDKHDELEKGVNDLNAGFAGEYVKKGLTTDEIAKQLGGVESLAQEVFKGFKAEDAIKEQKASLPANVDSLKPKGKKLGEGAFGAVYALDNDNGAALVGKSFTASDDTALKEMEHEAEVYAQIGEHPNIAKCYGIHEVEAKGDKKPMLVMDKIEGPDVEKVFDDLDERYRDGELSRTEYLAGLQHIMKGTLMGLAHMESMGLVHKDIKGDNIKFDKRTNQVTLIDMGLAQAEGAHEVKKSWVFIEPPENRAGRTGPDDKVVTSVWDSFTVGKLLFEEMERDSDGDRNVLTPGDDPTPKDQAMGALHFSKFTGAGAKSILGRNASGELEAKTDAQGNVIGQALKKGEDADEAGDAGYYGAETAYVDFMNRLTHPDPSRRMTSAEALKHPFMTGALSSEMDMDKVFGPKLDPAAAAKPAKPADDDIFSLPDDESDDEDDVSEDDIFGESGDSSIGAASTGAKPVAYNNDELNLSGEASQSDSPEGESASTSPASPAKPTAYNNDELELSGSEEGEDASESSASPASSSGYNNDELELSGGEEEEESGSSSSSSSAASSSSSSAADTESESESEDSDDVSPAPASDTKPAQTRKEVKEVLARGASPLQMWKIAVQQVDQQFGSAYSNLEGDKNALKAAGFTKGNKFSKYFTYNKSLDKLIDKLEKSRAKRTKTLAKDRANVLDATKHYREKITRKADTDFGWANASPAIKPPFWKTMVEALDDVDAWVNSK